MATLPDESEKDLTTVPDTENVETNATEPEVKLDRSDFMTLIANALKAGTISSAQAKQMRQELGVFQGDFTKKKQSAKQKKEKRKAQKAARAVTRNHGFKGQKVDKGRGAQRGR